MTTIILQRYSGASNKAVKTVAEIITLNGVFRGETGVVNPEILLEGDLSHYTETVNYFTIPAFKRSYFVREFTSVASQAYRITGHTDVLSSFWNQTKEHDALISRAENKYNLYLHDNLFQVEQRPMIQQIKIGSGFNPSAASYILALTGNGGSVT